MVRAGPGNGWLSCAGALLLAALSAGCGIPVERRDWSAYDGPGRERFLAEEVPYPYAPDPLEPMNRSLAVVNYGLIRFVLAPAARGYRFVLPRFVRTGIDNFATNLGYPGRLVNNLAQGKWGGSGRETLRFLVNTTVGVLGLFDPATDWLAIEPSVEDTGQSLAKAGWDESTYLFVPLIGPTSVRDGLGNVGDIVLHPLFYVPFGTLGALFNRRSDEFDGILRAIHSNADVYHIARLLHVLERRVLATDYAWVPVGDDTGEVQTLAAVSLEAQDDEFPERREDRTVALPAGPAGGPAGGERRVTYSAWMQPGSASVVYLVPGLGAHRLSDSTLGMVELAYDAGASVVCLSSALNFEFMEQTASTPLPGYVPVDALDVHRALDAIAVDVERRWPEHAAGAERILVGASLGGMHVLHIAAARERGHRALVRFDVYAAIDSPVSLRAAVEQLDAFYNAPLAFPAEERDARVQEILLKVSSLAEGRLQPKVDLPFTREEAEFIIGLAYRQSLQAVLLASQERYDLGVLQTARTFFRRTPAYVEASEYSYMEYVYGFLLPYHAARSEAVTFDEAGAERLFAACDLRSLEAGLRDNARVRVFANSNDFLLDRADRDWLQDVLGERVTFFRDGGHLGNLHRGRVVEVIESTIGSASEEAEAEGAEGVGAP